MTDFVQIGVLRNAGKRPDEGWYEFGDQILPSNLLGFGEGRTINTWRLVEYIGNGRAVICNTWRTATMPAPAFHYFIAPFIAWPNWSQEPRPATMCVQLDADTGAISLPDSPAISLPEIPAEKPVENALANYVNILLASNEGGFHSAAEVIDELEGFMRDSGLYKDPMALASERVLDVPELEPYGDVILRGDWNEPDHIAWAATCPLAELLDWAETVTYEA